MAWSRSKSYSWKRRAKWKRTSSGFFPTKQMASPWQFHCFAHGRLVSLFGLAVERGGYEVVQGPPPSIHHLYPSGTELQDICFLSATERYCSPPPHPTPPRRLVCVSVPGNKKHKKKNVSCSRNARKLQKTRSRCDASNVKTHAKPVSRHAAFYPRPVNYMDPNHSEFKRSFLTKITELFMGKDGQFSRKSSSF